MKMKILWSVGIASSLVLGVADFVSAGDDPGSTTKLRLTLRGGSSTDPAQTEAARAATRQAEMDAAEVEAKAQEERDGKRARRLSQESLQHRDAPLRNFGVLSGPLSPTVPSTIRR